MVAKHSMKKRTRAKSERSSGVPHPTLGGMETLGAMPLGGMYSRAKKPKSGPAKGEDFSSLKSLNVMGSKSAKTTKTAKKSPKGKKTK